GLVGIRSGSVGREVVRDELWGCLRRAAEGKTTAVVLRGVEGIGKTHLTRWLAGMAHERIGATELVVEGGDGDDGLIVAFRHRLGLEGLGWWDGRQRIGAWLARTGGAGWLESRSVQKVLEPGVLPPESFGAIADLLRRAAHQRPLVVRIEDAQRLPDHLAFVTWVLAERRDLPVLFLLTLRDEAVRSQPGLQEALQALTWAGGRDRLLGELRGGDNDRFVAEHLGLAPDLRGAVARCASGNPGVARGLLRRYASVDGLEVDEDGLWRRVGGGAVELDDEEIAPARERVGGFLQGRGDGDRDTLELAATLGRDVTTTELDAALRSAEVFRGPRLTSELVTAGLWQLSEAGWSFVDGRTVEVLRRQAAEAGRARRWNEVAGRVLEGDPRPWARLRRARFLYRAWRVEDAVMPWVEGLRDLLDERPPADSADDIAALARCVSEAGHLEPVVDELLVELWRWAGETERARRVATSLRALEAKRPDAAALGIRILAELQLDALEVDDAAQLAASAVRAATNQQQRVSSRIVLARTHLLVGRIGACAELLEQARSMGRGGGRPEGEALLAQAELAAAEGRIAEASAWVARAEGMARPTFRSRTRAVVAIAAGDLGQAVIAARDARDAWRSAGQPELVRSAEVVLGGALLAIGEADEALACFRSAARSPSISLRATAQAGKVAVAAVRGDRKSVDERLGTLSRMPRLSGVVLPGMSDLLALSAHALRPVHPDRAQAIAGLAAQGLNPLGRSDEATGDRRPRLVLKA
ncbi:MAG: ATP-binding protein, partial [Myxococcales bacterium]|nr:ATP-binding protein [Myxococcales bacterium]